MGNCVKFKLYITLGTVFEISRAFLTVIITVNTLLLNCIIYCCFWRALYKTLGFIEFVLGVGGRTGCTVICLLRASTALGVDGVTVSTDVQTVISIVSWVT